MNKVDIYKHMNFYRGAELSTRDLVLILYPKVRWELCNLLPSDVSTIKSDPKDLLIIK